MYVSTTHFQKKKDLVHEMQQKNYWAKRYLQQLLRCKSEHNCKQYDAYLEMIWIEIFRTKASKNFHLKAKFSS